MLERLQSARGRKERTWRTSDRWLKTTVPLCYFWATTSYLCVMHGEKKKSETGEISKTQIGHLGLDCKAIQELLAASTSNWASCVQEKILFSPIVPEILLPQPKLPSSQLEISTVAHKAEDIMLNCKLTHVFLGQVGDTEDGLGTSLLPPLQMNWAINSAFSVETK